MLSVASIGDPFAANMQTAGSQLTYGQLRAPAVATDNDGDYVAVWSSEESAGAGYDVYGQLFNSTGTPIGTEFRVNETTASEQKFAAVAMDDDGDFVVTWSSLWQDGSLYGVYARRYDASGTPQDGEFRVNQTVDDNQNFSAVAIDADGDFTIAWTSTAQDGDRTGVFARRYGADGTALSDEIAVNTTTAGNQRYPVIASDSMGETVVVWTSDGQDGSSGGIYAQRLASDGTPIGSELPVNATTAGNQQLPSVAVAPGGNFLVAWQGFDLTDGEWKVYVQAYEASGTAVGVETIAGAGRHVSVTINNAGDFVVAWEAPSASDASHKDIHVQHFNPLGVPDGTTMVYHNGDASLTAPSIAMRDTEAVTIWTATGTAGQGSDVHGQRVQSTLSGTFNQPPAITVPSGTTIDENQLITLNLSATDPDVPAQDLTFALTGNPPVGATIDPVTGQFNWTPGESAGSQSFDIVVRVTDSGTPALSDQASFRITVNEVNQTPILASLDDVTVSEGDLVSLDFTATDGDDPAQTLTYSIDPAAPADATFDTATGAFRWTPGESDGGSQHTITVTVTDDGTPALSDSTSVTITVDEANAAPTITDPGEQILEMGDTLSLTLTANDTDQPANTLTWSLDTGAPVGAVLDSGTGQLTWTPTVTDGPGTHTIPIRVTDDGSPNESATLSLDVVVEAAMLEKPADQTVDEETELTVQAVLTTPYDLATGLTFSLDPGSPTGATIDAQTGLLTWTPSEQQGPGDHTVIVRVTDDADSDYTDSETFTVTVQETNADPELETIDDITLAAGAPFYLPLRANDPDGETLFFSAVTTEPQLVATISDTNRSLRLNLSGFGVMEFELFEGRAPNTTGRIVELAESDFYDGLLIHRVAQMADGSPFVIQGGDPDGNGTGSSGRQFDDEFHVELQHTAAGVLSMANSGDDTNDSQFFVTGQATRFLDFNHAVFGYQTSGEDVRAAIEAVATDGADKPLSDVVIQSAEVFVDPETGLLVLVAPEGFTGELDVTVTVADGAGLTDQQTFHVTVVADTDPAANSPPYLETVSDIQTTADQPVTVTIPARDAEDDTIYFSAEVVGASGDVSVTINETTGEATITPTATAVGVYTVRFAVGAASGVLHDTQLVPVLVQPARPSSITLTGVSDTGWSAADGITNLNNNVGGPLVVEVSGIVAGAEVTLYAGSNVLGATTTAGGGTVTITTNETSPLSDGLHTLTAVQELSDVSLDVGNRDETVTLTSQASTPSAITVDTVPPQITSAAVEEASAGLAYTYDVESPEEATSGVRFELGSAPTGMTIDTATGTISWPSPTETGSPHSVAVRAVDVAGNIVEQAFDLTVTVSTNLPPILSSIGDRRISELVSITFTATATDPDLPADTLRFSLSGNVPSGADIDEESGLFSWTPTTVQAPGVYTFTVEVSDGELTDQEEITITVSVVHIQGTPGNDVIDFTAGEVGGTWHSVTVNGSTESYDPALVDAFRIDGVGGNDHLTLQGTTGDEEATLLPGSIDMLGPGYAVHGIHVGTIHVDAGPGGNDRVSLSGSSGSHRLYSYADHSILSDSVKSFSHRVAGFDQVSVDAAGDGRDYAYLYDSSDDDVLDASPDHVELARQDASASRTATGFERVYAYATNGGNDVATLTGSDTTRNRLYGYADYSILTESRRSFYYYARGFETVTGQSPGVGTSYAYLYDSTGDDSLTATPTSAAMDRAEPWSDTTAAGFQRVYAYSTRGGNDSALLTGSASGGNQFRAYPTYSTLTDTAGSFYHYARGFRWLTAEGSETDSSTDRAYLYDSSGDDIFRDDGQYGYLEDKAGTTYQNRFRYFDLVYARSSDDGTDDTIDIDPAQQLAYNLIRSGTW